MIVRIVFSLFVTALLLGGPAFAQPRVSATPAAAQFVDPANGLSLQDAIALALKQEPSLQAARAGVDVARGMRAQASLRSNPTLSFERRQEPAGTDDQTTIGVEWPLDLFRRGSRVAAADREIEAVQFAVADQERQLASEVRTRYGAVLSAVRDLVILDQLVTTTQRQYEVLRARVEQGAAPPLERDLLDVELRRLQADRVMQTGRAEAARFELKRVLGMHADAALTVRDTLEDAVQHDAAAPAQAPIAIEHRSDVKEAAARIGVAEAKIGRSQSEGRVDVSLFANYMRMDAGFLQRGFAADGSLERVRGQFNYWSAGAMITIPIFSRNQGQIASARAERTGAAAAYDAARLTAEAELAAARTRDEHARQAVSTFSADARTLARRNLDVVSQSYDLGRVTVFDVLAEQRRYFEVERAYTEALRAAYEARTALNLAVGGVR